MNDPYQTLGVSKTASADEIKRAYRKLAKKLHPDVNKGAEAQFKDATSAYDLLSDSDKRARFDRGEIDAQGNERPEAAFRRARAGGFGGGNPGGMGGRPGGGPGGFEAQDMFGDILDDLLRGGGGRAQPRPRRGADVKVQLRVPFLTAVNGGSVRVTLPAGRTVDLKIPAGATEGQVLRLSGQGDPGMGGPPGDVHVELRIDMHPLFRREGNDIHADLPVTLAEAVLGGRVAAPTVDGTVMLTIPPNSTGRNTLRLKGKGLRAADGVTRGDQYVHVRIVLPEGGDDALRAFVETWKSEKPYDPRAGLT